MNFSLLHIRQEEEADSQRGEQGCGGLGPRPAKSILNSGLPGFGPKLFLPHPFPPLNITSHSLPSPPAPPAGAKNKGVFPSRLMSTTVKSQTHIYKEPDRCLPMFSGQCQEPLKDSYTTTGDWPQAKCEPGKMTPGSPFLTGSFPCCSLTTAVSTARLFHAKLGASTWGHHLSLYEGHCGDSHFTDEETKAWGGDVLCPT